MDQKTLKLFEKILNKALANLVTKDEAKNFSTKDDLKKFATKEELFERFDKLDKMQMAIIESTDETKKDRTTVQALKERVDRIEQKLVH